MAWSSRLARILQCSLCARHDCKRSAQKSTELYARQADFSGLHPGLTHAVECCNRLRCNRLAAGLTLKAFAQVWPAKQAAALRAARAFQAWWRQVLKADA